MATTTYFQYCLSHKKIKPRTAGLQEAQRVTDTIFKPLRVGRPPKKSQSQDRKNRKARQGLGSTMKRRRAICPRA